MVLHFHWFHFKNLGKLNHLGQQKKKRKCGIFKEISATPNRKMVLLKIQMSMDLQSSHR